MCYYFTYMNFNFLTYYIGIVESLKKQMYIKCFGIVSYAKKMLQMGASIVTFLLYCLFYNEHISF
jgi:hypothetical protein